jgi:uncharacterized protein YukJ/nucleotide-binding universal stress UspA family protein
MRSNLDTSDLLFLIVDPFVHPMTRYLEVLPEGFTPNRFNVENLALDYVRGGYVTRKDMMPLNKGVQKPVKDFTEQLNSLINRAILNTDVMIYAFGERWGPEPDIKDKYFGFQPGNGIHDIHMNQGNVGEFIKDDGVWQDGGLLIYFPEDDRTAEHWVAIFIAFESQDWSTDAQSGHSLESFVKPPIGWDILGELNPNVLRLTWILVLIVVILLGITWVLARRRGAISSPREHPASKEVILGLDGPFDVFLSYNSKDRTEVLALAKSLRSHGLRVWYDEWELIPGRPWQEAIEAQMDRIGSAAVLVGSSGLGPWQDREMRSFLTEFVNRNLPVIPVLLPNAVSKPELPLSLKQFTWVDLRNKNIDEGIERLIWGITGRKPSAFQASDNGVFKK